MCRILFLIPKLIRVSCLKNERKNYAMPRAHEKRRPRREHLEVHLTLWADINKKRRKRNEKNSRNVPFTVHDFCTVRMWRH